MDKRKANVPKIRYPGFTEEWERRKIRDVTEELNQYVTLCSGLPLLTSSRRGLMMQSEFRDTSSTDNNNTLFSIVPLGACTYRHMSDDDIFHFNINEIIEKGIVSREYPVFFASRGNNLVTIVQYLNSNNKFKTFCKEQKMGGTRTRLYYKSLCSFEILLPTEKEQDQIADFLKQFDNLIALHQRKLNHLQAKKKGLLQKMFPKDGEVVPELRFPGFTEAWERCKLGEMCDEFQSGKSIKSENINDMGDYPVFGGNGFRGYTNIYNHDGLYALIGRQGALCGNMNISTGRAYFTEHAVVVKANRSNETKFLFYLLGKMNLGQYSGQSAQPGLAVNKLIELRTVVPNCVEQTRIGAFFTVFDKLISLHQRKLTHLQEQKQALLQQMFV